MAGDDPPFLPVGTAVSAKYRGAFCEAKVKVVKKLVKCKIKFKTGPGVVVNDEFVKGPLKIGAVVEAKQTENVPYEQGTVMKLNDASLYTVVFDDGDEKTLRRTLLCLQGEKHFHESETLDHLPLTDPENFGTPVMKQNKKRNRRSSNRSQSDDDEEEEEEEEESDSDSSPKKQRKEEAEDAVSKVVIVEFNEKRKNSLFPALVVDPSCTKDVQMRGKDQVVVRSFKDNKYYTVAKSSRKPFLTKDHTYKGDVASQKSATEKAVTFIDTGQLPSNWDLEMLKKKTKQGHVDPVEETSEDSSDDEYDMEKDAWLASLHKFMEERGTPINKPPVLGFRDLNLYKLYKLVHEHGGCRKVTDKQLWRNIMTKMGIPVSTSPQPYNIHTAYNKYLFAFEEFNRKMGPSPRVFTRTRRRSFDRGWITPGIIQRHQSSSSKQEIKDEPSDNDDDVDDTPKKRKKVTRKKEKEEEPPSKPEPEAESRETKEPKEPKRETRDSKSRVRDNNEGEEAEPMDREDRRTPKRGSREEKVTKDRLSKDDRGKEKEDDGSSSRERTSREERSRDRLKEERGGGGGDKKSGVDDRGKDRARDGRGKEGAKDEKLTPGKAAAMKLKDKKPSIQGDGSKEDVCKSPDVKADYKIGEKVLVHYGRGRTEKIYEAKVVDIELKGKEPVFTVHYTGWNNRYDEAVKKSRIVGSAEKKKKKGTPKGKSENKDSSKKDSDQREKEEEDKKKKDEEEKKEQEEMEAKAREAKELEERQEKEKQEQEKAERERQEKEMKEKECRERERREKVEKERLEKERKDKLERERREQEERERKEKMERERKEKEQRERQEKERQDREKKEKQEREKQEKERREKEERDRREKEKADQERRNKEAAEKAKEAEKEKKEKEKLAKEGKRTPSGKRGRPSLSKASPVAPSPPRSTPTSSRGNKSPSPASVFTQRSMRSDRKSLETPFASGLYVRSRSTRSSTGDKHSPDSDSDADDAYDQSESQQSAHESEDSSKAKDGRVQEKDEIRVIGRTGKTEAPAATLIKVSEQKPTTFDEDSDDGPPTLTAQVSLVEAPESRLQEAGTAAEVPKTGVQKSTGEDQEVSSRSRSRKDSSSKLRVRKTQDREKDVSRDTAADLPSDEKQSTKEGKEDKVEEVGKKMEETPVLERQVPMETQLKEKLEEIKQEDKDSTSDADKVPEKRKGRKKGRKSLESRKRAKTEPEPADTATKASTTTTETFEPKRKQAKVERRKSDKGGRKKQNEQDSRLPADNADSDLVSSSMEEKSLAGTSKSFMTTPPTTPEGSPKMPSSPSQEDLNLKGEEQSSNKSDSDALIEVASIDDKEAMQTPDINSSVIGTPSGATQLKATPTPTLQDPSPKKRRRGISESEPGKKRRKRSRRRKSSMSERRDPDHQDRGNSSDTDESRSDSRLMSSASKHHFMTDFPEMPPSNLSDSANSQKQRRWNFVVDLSTVKEPDERIAIIQRNLKDLRSVYTRLKQEVATIDRRRKKFRKKEREAAQVMAGVGLGCLSQGTEKPEGIVT